MKRKVLNYSIRTFIQKLLGLLCYLLGSWWIISWRVWLYFALGLVMTVISILVIYRINPETLAERGKVVTDSPLWDKLLLGVFWFLHFFVIYFIAGFEAKKMTGSADHTVLFWSGIVLGIFSGAIATTALAANIYLESTARIQTDRGQKVISGGVYSVVRHPTYLAVLISCISSSFVFPTPFVITTATIIAVIIIIRTYLEDKMLKEKLQGYPEYSLKVKYRLVPFVW